MQAFTELISLYSSQLSCSDLRKKWSFSLFQHWIPLWWQNTLAQAIRNSHRDPFRFSYVPCSMNNIVAALSRVPQQNSIIALCFMRLICVGGFLWHLPFLRWKKKKKKYDISPKNRLSPSGYISGIVREDERVNDPSKMSQLVNGLRSIEQIE